MLWGSSRKRVKLLFLCVCWKHFPASLGKLRSVLGTHSSVINSNGDGKSIDWNSASAWTGPHTFSYMNKWDFNVVRKAQGRWTFMSVHGQDVCLRCTEHGFYEAVIQAAAGCFSVKVTVWLAKLKRKLNGYQLLAVCYMPGNIQALCTFFNVQEL